MEIGKILRWKIKNDKGKLRERDTRQLGNHEGGIEEKWILGKRENSNLSRNGLNI